MKLTLAALTLVLARNNKILIVEDDESMLMLLQDYVEQLGFPNVTFADSFSKAKPLVMHDNWDVLITDNNIGPGGKGTDLAKIAKDKDIPVVSISGNLPEDEEAHYDLVIPKPFSSVQLKQALELKPKK